MSNEIRFLTAMCEALGLEVEDIVLNCYNGEPINFDYKITKKAKKTRTKKEIGYTLIFEDIWKITPKVDGNSKQDAFREYQLKLKENVFETEISLGVERYARYVEATGTKFVYKLHNFIRKDMFKDEWIAPKKELNKEQLATRIAEIKKEPWAQIPNTLKVPEIAAFAAANGYKYNLKLIESLDDITQLKRSIQVQIDDRVNREI